MADFKQAYEKVMNQEGFYSNVQGDPGGETWKGIARNYNKMWPGWEIIDDLKHTYPPSTMLQKLNSVLNSDLTLESHVQQLYKTNYWDVFLGDQIVVDQPGIQLICDELFDQSVNLGPARAIKHLQEALNIFQSVERLVVDGVFGKRSWLVLRAFLNKANAIQIKGFLIDLNVQQGAWYHHLALEHGMGRFLGSSKGLGWYKRVEL